MTNKKESRNETGKSESKESFIIVILSENESTPQAVIAYREANRSRFIVRFDRSLIKRTTDRNYTIYLRFFTKINKLFYLHCLSRSTVELKFCIVMYLR